MKILRLCLALAATFVSTSAASAQEQLNYGVPPPVPTIPDIHSAISAAVSQPGALDMGAWHRCEKTHCRAGWVVTLAGDAGKALEAFYDTALAAMKIYDASSALPKVSPVRFFDGNEEALADMKRMAEIEARTA